MFYFNKISVSSGISCLFYNSSCCNRFVRSIIFRRNFSALLSLRELCCRLSSFSNKQCFSTESIAASVMLSQSNRVKTFIILQPFAKAVIPTSLHGPPTIRNVFKAEHFLPRATRTAFVTQFAWAVLNNRNDVLFFNVLIVGDAQPFEPRTIVSQCKPTCRCNILTSRQINILQLGTTSH